MLKRQSADAWIPLSARHTYNYITMFRDAPSVSEYIAEKGIGIGGNRLSYIYEAMMHELTDNYHIYFFFPACLSSCAVVKLFKRYSVNPAFSLLILFSLGTYIMYMAALKQCFAMFFLLMSIPYLENRKYGRFYLCVIIAMTFHTHAFMFLIVPFLCAKKGAFGCPCNIPPGICYYSCRRYPVNMTWGHVPWRC